ncbi:MAG: hypothetical protein CMD62_06070 [Gammaproteobacteria bacterium]|nr:hypothetical protein [Gammaproteobacteria bacterium]
MRIEQIMNKLKSLFFLILFVVANTSYSLQDSVVAIVNDKVILQSDLDERMKEINPKNLSRIEFIKVKNNILDQLVEESLLDQASFRMGIRISDIDLQNRLKLIAKNQGLTVLQLKDAVEKQNISYVKYLEKLRRNIQRQELFRTQFDNRAYISDEEIESFLTNNKLPQIDARMKIKEYIIQDKTNKLNLSQATIVLDGVKATGLEDEEKKYPAYDIKMTVLNDVQAHKLPDIYQGNLQLLDKDKFSRVFKTGKGFTMLHVLESNVLVEEYKVSHILMMINPMEGPKEIKKRFYEIKTSVQNGESFSKYAEEFSKDKASAIKGGSLGWITKELVVENFRKVMTNTEVGGVSEPFNTRFGWHILYLEDKRIKNISENIRRNQAIAILKDRKVAVAKKEWLARLKDQAYIEYVR